jgi:hypothetical protein
MGHPRHHSLSATGEPREKVGFDKTSKDLEGTTEELSVDLHDGSPTGPTHHLVLIGSSGIVLANPIGTDDLGSQHRKEFLLRVQPMGTGGIEEGDPIPGNHR